MFKSGYIAILGAPNAGKSTLLNSILEEKLAAVSAKPQTTRKRFLGIYTTKTCQMIFLDTPGIHSSDKQLNQFMHQEVMEAITDADVLVFLVSLDQELSEELVRVHQWVQKKFPEKKRILVTNKVDLSHVTPATLSAVGGFGQAGAQGLDSRFPESRVAGSRGGNDVGRVILRGQEVIVHFSGLENIPISSLTGEGIPDLLKKLEEFLSEGQAFYPEEDLTTENMRSIVAEIIREKAFENLHEEIPYGLAVEILKFKESVGAPLAAPPTHITANLVVERDSQKGMVIGKAGAMIKKIGSLARADIEKLLDGKIFLELQVKVDKNWTKDPRRLAYYGYEIPRK